MRPTFIHALTGLLLGTALAGLLNVPGRVVAHQESIPPVHAPHAVKPQPEPVVRVSPALERPPVTRKAPPPKPRVVVRRVVVKTFVPRPQPVRPQPTPAPAPEPAAKPQPAPAAAPPPAPPPAEPAPPKVVLAQPADDDEHGRKAKKQKKAKKAKKTKKEKKGHDRHGDEPEHDDEDEKKDKKDKGKDD